MSGGLVGVNLRGGLVGKDPLDEYIRELLIDDDGDGRTHEVTGSDVTSVIVTIPERLRSSNHFRLFCGIVCSTSILTYVRARPNGVFDNTYSAAHGAYSGSTSIAFEDNGNGLLLHASSTEATFVKLRINAEFWRDGQEWGHTCKVTGFSGAGGKRTLSIGGRIAGYNTDWSTLQLVASVAALIKVGSTFELRGEP